MKITLIILLFVFSLLNKTLSQTDSISISEYQNDCIKVNKEEFTIENDSSNVKFSNGIIKLIVNKYDYPILELLFSSNKISLEAINKIINNGKSIPGFNTFYTGGHNDLSHLLTGNSSGNYRLIELFIMNDSGHPDSVHILLFLNTANKLTDLLEFIEKSDLICFKYDHTQV